MQILFWSLFFIVFYSYVGYGFLLFVLIRIKRLFRGKKSQPIAEEPSITFIVPCYNEKDIIDQKVANTLALDYPKDKLEIIFISDGSNDGTDAAIARHESIRLMHRTERKGKAAAMNRAIEEAQHPIIVFTDANTIINAQALRLIARHYADPQIGAVAGEKRLRLQEKENASGAGEGIYWKYESLLKKWDTELLTVVGAAGELFSVRKELYEHLEEDTLLDDFMQTLRIAGKGFRVVYEPEAYAVETASASVKEELKRKIRICAGGWQSMVRLSYLLNPFRYPILSFQYISHRVLRWSLAPAALPLLVILNILLALEGNSFYQLLLIAQCAFYVVALSGWYLENRSIRIKALFVPYYFFIMNYAVYAGFLRYTKGKQSALWERAQRAE